jgi:hypothetical protein
VSANDSGDEADLIFKGRIPTDGIDNYGEFNVVDLITDTIHFGKQYVFIQLDPDNEQPLITGSNRNRELIDIVYFTDHKFPFVINVKELIPLKDQSTENGKITLEVTNNSDHPLFFPRPTQTTLLTGNPEIAAGGTVELFYSIDREQCDPGRYNYIVRYNSNKETNYDTTIVFLDSNVINKYVDGAKFGISDVNLTTNHYLDLERHVDINLGAESNLNVLINGKGLEADGGTDLYQGLISSSPVNFTLRYSNGTIQEIGTFNVQQKSFLCSGINSIFNLSFIAQFEGNVTLVATDEFGTTVERSFEFINNHDISWIRIDSVVKQSDLNYAIAATFTETREGRMDDISVTAYIDGTAIVDEDGEPQYLSVERNEKLGYVSGNIQLDPCYANGKEHQFTFKLDDRWFYYSGSRRTYAYHLEQNVVNNTISSNSFVIDTIANNNTLSINDLSVGDADATIYIGDSARVTYEIISTGIASDYHKVTLYYSDDVSLDVADTVLVEDIDRTNLEGCDAVWKIIDLNTAAVAKMTEGPGYLIAELSTTSNKTVTNSVLFVRIVDESKSVEPEPEPEPKPEPEPEPIYCPTVQPVANGVRTNATTATLSWTAVPEVARYEILVNGEIVTTSSTQYTWSDLESSQKLSVIVRGHGGECPGPYSSRVTIPAFSNPCETVPNATAVRTNATTGTISWEAVEGATGYEIWSEDSTYETTTNEYTWSDLISSQKLSAIVRTKGNNCISPFSDRVAIPAFSNPCETVPTVTAIRTDATTGTISWEAIEGATGYEVWSEGTTYEATDNEYTWSDLESSKRRSALVRTTGNNCISPYSDRVTIPAFSNPCSNNPQGLTATINDGTNLTVTWDASSAAEYRVWSTIDRLGVNIETNSISYSTLTSNNVYSVYVRNQTSYCSSFWTKLTVTAGSGAVSEDQNFRTGNVFDEELPTLESVLTLYPNPTSSVLNLEIPGLNLGKAVIYSSSGIELYSFTMGEKFSTDLKGLERGLYILQLTDLENGKTVSKQFVIK